MRSAPPLRICGSRPMMRALQALRCRASVRDTGDSRGKRYAQSLRRFSKTGREHCPYMKRTLKTASDFTLRGAARRPGPRSTEWHRGLGKRAEESDAELDFPMRIGGDVGAAP